MRQLFPEDGPVQIAPFARRNRFNRIEGTALGRVDDVSTAAFATPVIKIPSG